MALERTYTIPLRREWLKAQKYKRAKKAVTAVRMFLKRHMKAELENIKIGKYINELLWKHGMKNPPPRIRINTTKDEKGIVFAELVGKPMPKKEEKKKEKTEKAAEGKAKEKAAGKKEESKAEKQEVAKEEKKKEEKEVITETKKGIKQEKPKEKKEGLK